MQSLYRVSASDLQRFLETPEELLRESEQMQIAVASFSDTPQSLLEVLGESDYSSVVEVARLHVNFADEIAGDYQEIVSEVLRNRDLGENDRLAVELMQYAAVPPCVLSEWVPVSRLIQGLQNEYMPLRYRLQLLERLSQSDKLEARLVVAESLETPVSLLEFLAGDLELAVRLTVESNSNCPSEVLELVRSQHDIASDWDADVERLRELGESRWSWIRLTVAQNPFAPEDALMKLARDEEFRIRLSVAKNPNVSAEVLAVLVEDSGKKIQGVVVKHPNTGEETLHKLFSGYKKEIAKRNDFPTSILERFYREEATDKPWKHKYLHVLVNESNTPTWILAELADVNLEELRAEKRKEQWEYLRFEESVWQSIWFLKQIAKHPHVSEDILSRLAEYPNAEVKLAVVRNQKTPEEIKERLWQYLVLHSDDKTKAEIAEDSITPPHILEIIGQNEFYPVKLLREIRRVFSTEYLPNGNCFGTLADIYMYDLQDKILHPAGIHIELNRYMEVIETPDILEHISNSLSWEEFDDDDDDDDDDENNRINWFLTRWLEVFPEIPENLNHKIANQIIRILELIADDVKRYDSQDSIVAKLIGNPNTPINLRESFKKQLVNNGFEDNVVSPISDNPQNSQQGRIEYYLVSDESMLDLVIDNRSLSALEIYQLVVEKENSLLATKAHELIAQRTNSFSSLAEVVETGYIRKKFAIARDSKTPVEILKRLTKDENVHVCACVLENPSFPSDCLMELAQNSNSSVQTYIARRTLPIPRDVIEWLLETGDISIRSNIANNKNTPLDILLTLAEDKESKVRINALTNPNIPAEVVSQALLDIEFDKQKEIEDILRRQGKTMRNSPLFSNVLERLSHHPKDFIRYLVAIKSTASATTLQRLASDEYNSIPEAVAENPSTPSSVLIELAKCDHLTTDDGCYHTISNKIAMRKDASPEALEYIVRQPVVPVVCEALRNANTPDSALEWLVENQDDEIILSAVVKHPNISPEILRCLSVNESANIREVVASQKKCPLEILETLAYDSDIEVKQKVAANRNTPNHILESFSQSENSAIRTAVASNPNLSVTILERLANDEKVEVRREVAKNPNTPEIIRESLQNLLLQPQTKEINPTLISVPRIYNPKTDDLPILLTEYAQSNNAFVRFTTLLHPITPEEILTQAANSASWLERYAVAENESTPLEIRSILACDANRIVRAAANNNL
ncbi:leucine rich repeat variant [Calothrix parasitica NIES-267]|uniref:Leucine rich repeat variant n=1 Tax=Calothrix parasitica NIES-267 TaxID=1973488 RepID=A0A1Z4LI80_9CYAN|nr:leucine rich repeat variant [Calothrix parasitica NIES-267]